MGAEASLSRRCDEAERQIEATRRRIQDKAGSLEDRLKPRALLRPVQKRLEETLGTGGGRILDAFRDNPLPLALTGLGLGWLLLRDLRRPASAAPAGESLSSKAEDVVHKARETARRTSDWFSTTLEEKPMLLAVGAMAAGVLAAFLAPVTPREEAAPGGKAAEVLEPETSPVQGDDAPPAT